MCCGSAALLTTRTTSAPAASQASLKSFPRSPGIRKMVLPLPQPPQTRTDSRWSTWTSTCSRCHRATGSLLLASLTTASKSLRLPPGHSLMMAETLRAGGNTRPGTATVPGSPGPASLPGGPPAATRASPHWKGSFSSWSMASSLQPPSQTWAWAPGASCTQTPWTTPGGPMAWMPSSHSCSISLKTRAPHLQTRRRSRPSPLSPSPRSTLRPRVPRVQGRLRAGRERAPAALQPPLPQRLHCALAGAARQLPCLPEEPHRPEHSHQSPGADAGELLVVLLLVILQLAQQ
ncbi:E3 ubiquitin-protein ligase RNF126 isoform X2 [Tenrec ecaudatus]|uniref:E3 ubiquitin-protein ligase RNF126 isoform X2 n=1 Tax=Tenrec ecaudatus TaxID=94439 RepID=UPI003F592FFD